MKLEEMLDKTWKDFLNANSKWLAGVLLRYGPLIMGALLLLLFAYGNYKASNIGNQYFVIKQGKTINITKVGTDTTVKDQKEIDSLLEDLNKLKGK